MLIVTHTAKCGPFLRIYGQTNRTEMRSVDTAIHRIIGSLLEMPAPTIEQLNMQSIVLGRRTLSDYSRCKVSGTGNNNRITVHFIDYGFDKQLTLNEIRLLNIQISEAMLLTSTLPQAKDFILSHVYGTFNIEHMSLILNELSGGTVTHAIEDIFEPFVFVSLTLNGNDYATSLIMRSMAQKTTTGEQKEAIQQLLRPNISVPRIMPQKTNFINIPESRQMIMSHLAPNYPRRGMPPMTPNPIGAPIQMDQMRMVSPAQYVVPEQVYMQTPSPVTQYVQQPIQQQQQQPLQQPNVAVAAADPHVQNVLNQLHQAQNPYAPQANATYSNSNCPKQGQSAQMNTGGAVVHRHPSTSDANYIIPTFKSNELSVGHEYIVYCSYIEDGPSLFSVQLVASEEDLDLMMSNLSNIPLKNLSQKPSIGMACIARYSEDKHLYRAVVMNIMPTDCQVVYVDYGNSEQVPYSDIYEIPDEYLHHSIFAIRFSLSGYKQLEPMTDELKSYFRTLAMENKLKLVVTPTEGPMFVQYCDLYYNGHNVLDLLLSKIKECPTYAPPAPLADSEYVVIRYVESPKKFFVQQSKHIHKYEEMMDRLMIYSQRAPALQNPQVGAACVARYGQDSDWYRVEIVEIINDQVLIQFVDFGIRTEAPIQSLKSISLDFLTVPRQAIECCLNGFESMPVLSETNRNQLEMLVEDSSGNRRNFRAKTITTLDNSVLVLSLVDDFEIPPMDLSIRMFQMCMPPKTFRYLEQNKFQKPAIYESFSQVDHPAGGPSTERENIVTTTVSEGQANLAASTNGNGPQAGNDYQQSKNRSIEKSGGWQKPDYMRQDRETKAPQQTAAPNSSYRPQLNHGKVSANWDNANKSASNISVHSDADTDSAFNTNNNNRNKPNNHYNDFDRKNQRNDRRTGAGDYNLKLNLNPNNNVQDDSQSNSWRNSKESSPKADNWSASNRNSERDSNRFDGRNEYRNADRDQNRYEDRNQYRNADRDQTRKPNQGGRWNEPKSFSNGSGGNTGGANNTNNESENWDTSVNTTNSSDAGGKWKKPNSFNSTSNDDDSWNNGTNSNVNNNHNNNNRRTNNDHPKSHRDKQPAYLSNKHIIPRFNKSNRTKGSETNAEPEEFVSVGHVLPEMKVNLNETISVALSWWISPIEFYAYPKNHEVDYEKMLSKLQQFYKCREPMQTNPAIGTYVIVRNKLDQLFYRAIVLAYNEQMEKFKVHFIDLGKKSIVMLNELWPMEMRFAKMQKMAIRCTMNVVLNASRQDIQEKIDSYIDPSKHLRCEFSSLVNDDTYIVNLFVEELNLKNVLINEQLISTKIEGLEYSRLIGQVISATIESIENLSNFCVQIYGCESSLKCSLKDIELNAVDQQQQQHQIETVRNLCGQWIPIRIDDLTNENTLIVTPLIEEFGEVVATVAPLPCPILLTNLDVTVPFIESVDVFYAHIYKNAGDLGQLLDDMYHFYEGKDKPSCTNMKENEICAVKSIDENWYRSIIQSVTDDGVLVKYLDYGNTEMVQPSNIKDLDASFHQWPAFAIKIHFPLTVTDPNNTQTILNELNNLVTDQILTMSILDYYQNCWIADLSSNESSIIRTFRQKQLADYTEIGTLHEQLDQNPNILSNVVCQTGTEAAAAAMAEEVPQNRLRAYISHTDHPDRFFLQLESDQSDLDQLQENLQIVAQSLPPLEDFSVGKLCIVKYSVDDLWYRAVIIDTDSEITSIQFIDFGNTDTITDNALIKSMDGAFTDVKHYAIRCTLPLTPKDRTEWCDEACKILQDIAADIIQFEYIYPNETKNFIRLYANDRDIIQELIDAKYAEPLDLIQSGEKCYVSHINSLNDFYVQMEKDTNGLEIISSYLADETKFDTIADLAEGTICTAKYVDDDQWYRVNILHQLPDKTEVLFVDYGNTSFTTNLRALPDEIAKLPYLSKRCALRLPAGIVEWSIEANQKFHEIANMGATIFTVRLITIGDPMEVDLFADGRNISQDLIDRMEMERMTEAAVVAADEKQVEPVDGAGECALKTGFVCVFFTYDNFYVQLDANDVDMQAVNQELENATEFERIDGDEVGKMCAAFYGDSYARAKVLEKCNDNQFKVFFIDYGNESNSNDLRVLPESIATIKPLAIHCTLNRTNVDVKLLEKLGKFIGDHLDDVFDFEFNDLNQEQTSDASIVVVYKDQINIVELIDHHDDDVATDKTPTTTTTTAEEAEAAEPVTEASTETVASSNDNNDLAICKDICQELIDNVCNEVDIVVKDIVNEIIDLTLDSPETEKALETVQQEFNVQTEAGYIIVFNSISDFYIQYDRHTSNIEEMVNSLNDAINWPTIDRREVGVLCAAIYNDDNCYYRARILEVINDNECKVHFIDYGNDSISSDLRQLPATIHDIEEYAHHCTLQETVPTPSPTTTSDQIDLNLYLRNNTNQLFNFILHNDCSSSSSESASSSASSTNHQSKVSILKSDINVIELNELENDEIDEHSPEATSSTYCDRLQIHLPDSTSEIAAAANNVNEINSFDQCSNTTDNSENVISSS